MQFLNKLFDHPLVRKIPTYYLQLVVLFATGLLVAQSYEEAFEVNGDKGYINDRYNAACSWALAGNSEAAFKQLFRIAEGGSLISRSDLQSDAYPYYSGNVKLVEYMEQ